MENISDRLERLRTLLQARDIDAYIVPREDEYLGEYIPAHNERLRWISGFTGSAGAAVVLSDRAAIFVDGRYTVQVRGEVPSDLYEYHHLVEEPAANWLAGVLEPGSIVVCDPRLHNLAWFRSSAEILQKAGVVLRADPDNLIDHVWLDRPEAVKCPALLLEDGYTGETSTSKRQRIGADIVAAGADRALVFAPDAVSWLLNIRGTDIPCLPVVQSFALLGGSGDMTLFIDPARLPDGLARHVGEGVEVLPETAAEDVLGSLAGQRILADPEGANAWTQLTLEQGGAVLVAGADPVALPKACKNQVEIEGSRRAHLRDAVAEIRFLAWLDAELAAGQLHDEAGLAERLYELRSEGEAFRDLSFDTISAAGANAAMCHYNHKNTEPAELTMNSVYLFDSGGQYTDGTTDITRTVAIGDPGAEVRKMFTLVLKGHIALDQARFPRGTSGSQLDALARQFLWREGFDYDHGTGHGVGVFLSVHEGPQRISKVPNKVPLLPGMIVSNEPGYYRDGAFGIRCENLLVVKEATYGGGDSAMLEFEALTLVPFDTRLIDPSLLSAAELNWVDDYHRRVRDRCAPLLEGAERAWLEQATRPLNI